MSRNSRSASSCRRTPSDSRRYSAAGDNAMSNLDEELRSVLGKEYDDGEGGKKEAIQDVKTVLKEVSQDPMAKAMDQILPRFRTAVSTSGESAMEEAQRVRSRSKNATPRHAKLTARPSARGKTLSSQLTGETASVPNIPPKSVTDQDNLTTRPVTSAPRLPETTTIYSTTSFAQDKSSTTSLTEDDVVTSHHPEESGSLMSHMIEGKEGGEEDYEDEELPYTENLLEVRTDSEDPDEIWKSDIVQLTRLKSAPKGTATGAEVLELKYKEPIWPHQPFLNQILARRPRLTHLVLDGSELRFLRDLGSSLQSLITLSICDCGLRSLDGAYAMPNLRTLIARQNLICIPTQLSFLTQLRYLDLSSNPISTFDEFGNLILCGELRVLKLHDTPLATHPNFNKELKRAVPQLKEIHPSQYDILAELKQIRKQGQQQMREESKQVQDKRGNWMMPSLAYDDVMLDEPKSGIANQRIPKTKRNLPGADHQEQESEIEDVSLGTGDFNQVYMAPKFLQHLEKAMPPSTAELQAVEEFQLQTQGDQGPNNFAASTTTATSYHDEIYHQGGGEENVKQDGNNENSGNNTQKKESDEVNQSASSAKRHPRGDGDSIAN